MNALLGKLAHKTGLAWLLILTVALAAAWLTWRVQLGELERSAEVQASIDAQRLGTELISETFKGDLIGALSLLGLIDPGMKQEVTGVPGTVEERAGRTALLARVAGAYGAEGIFVVDRKGKIASSWDRSGKSSTGIEVAFRPYFQMAMQGKESVYAAVSLARDDRVLYFAAPIRVSDTLSSPAVGALVARGSLSRVDALLKTAGHAFLLSPQGVVFASSQPAWIGYLAGEASPERLQAIRALKQFGHQFETATPERLPLSLAPGMQTVQGQRYAVARSKVPWNDPQGDWQLLLLREISPDSGGKAWIFPALTAFLVGLAGMLWLLMWRVQYRQWQSAQQLDAYACAQQASAERKAHMAAASIRLQQAQTLSELGRTFLAETHALFDALQGVVYVVTAEGEMTLAASYACSGELPEKLRLGEGLLGQCAQERQPRLLRMVAEGFVTIRSGLGETVPAAILMAPILCHERLLGVVEIAFLHSPENQEREQFVEMTALLGMNIEMIHRSLRTQALLESTAQAERSNAEQLAFQQALMDAIPYPVFYKGPDTCFLGFNRAYEAAFGVRREDLIGKRVLELDFLPESERLACQAEDERVLATAQRVQRPMRLRLADGQSHETLYSVSGFRRSDGSPGGLVGLFIDHTDFRSAFSDPGWAGKAYLTPGEKT